MDPHPGPLPILGEGEGETVGNGMKREVAEATYRTGLKAAVLLTEAGLNRAAIGAANPAGNQPPKGVV